jgi:hypothetical protein
MERFAREDALGALARFGVAQTSRATTTDSTEELILLAKADYESLDVQALTLSLMDVLPHTKGWVIAAGPRWLTEPI